MKPSRKISHTLTKILIKSAEQSLEPRRVSAAMGTKDSDAFSNAVRQKYIDAVNKVLQKNRNEVISDYAIDLVEMMQPVLERSMTAKELQSIARFIESAAFIKLINDTEFVNSCFSAREKMNNRVMEIINGDEVYSIMKNAAKDVVDDITRSLGLDDETPT
jgi:hypothetical protein